MRKTFTGSCVLLGVVVALLSATALAGVGDLEYAKGPPRGRGLSVQFTSLKTIPSKGKLVVASGKVGGADVSAALTGGETFTSMRLDMTGKSDFRNAPKVPVTTSRKTATMYLATIGPAQVNVKKDGRTVPVTVSGQYYETKGTPRLMLTLTAAAEGTCKFGKTTRKVRITDASGNLAFSDAATSKPRNRPDLVEIAGENGQFVASTTGGSPLGHPVHVDGKWYTMAVKGMKVSAATATCAMGKITGKGDNWQITMRGAKYSFTLDGGSKPIEVPADTYQVMRCNYFDTTGDSRKGRAMVSSYPHVSIKVLQGKTVAVPMGMPLKAEMAARVTNGRVAFSVKRTDAAGGRIVSLINASGRAPKAPAIEVLDKTGNIVYTAQLEYG